MGVGIEVKGLNAWYGKHLALKDIDMSVLANHVTAVIGPSGCGKSTFVRCLNRMHETIPEARADGDVNDGLGGLFLEQLSVGGPPGVASLGRERCAAWSAEVGLAARFVGFGQQLEVEEDFPTAYWPLGRSHVHRERVGQGNQPIDVKTEIDSTRPGTATTAKRFAGPRGMARRPGVGLRAFDAGGGQLDQTLEKIGGRAVAPAGLPGRFPRLVGFPVVAVVEQIATSRYSRESNHRRSSNAAGSGKG